MIHSTPVISSYSESTLTEMYRSNAIAELKKGSKYQKCPGSNELFFAPLGYLPSHIQRA